MLIAFVWAYKSGVFLMSFAQSKSKSMEEKPEAYVNTD
jgi:hypothetical protein